MGYEFIYYAPISLIFFYPRVIPIKYSKINIPARESKLNLSILSKNLLLYTKIIHICSFS